MSSSIVTKNFSDREVIKNKTDGVKADEIKNPEMVNEANEKVNEPVKLKASDPRANKKLEGKKENQISENELPMVNMSDNETEINSTDRENWLYHSTVTNSTDDETNQKIDKIIGTERLNDLKENGLPKNIRQFTEADISELKVDTKFLGKGGFGMVNLVENTKINSELKKLSRTKNNVMPGFKICYKSCNYTNDRGKLIIEYEILVLSELFHKNIVELLGYYHHEKERQYYMVMPFAGVDLKYFMEKELPTYTKEEAKYILEIKGRRNEKNFILENSVLQNLGLKSI